MAAALMTPAQGQLPNSKGTLYTVPGSTKTLFLRATLVNTDTSDHTVNIYLKSAAGTSKRITPVSLSISAGQMYKVAIGGHELNAGGLLEGDADSASVIDYYVSGVEFS
jgi:hypothetical protein